MNELYIVFHNDVDKPCRAKVRNTDTKVVGLCFDGCLIALVTKFYRFSEEETVCLGPLAAVQRYAVVSLFFRNGAKAFVKNFDVPFSFGLRGKAF